jgi:hypothetical protein
MSFSFGSRTLVDVHTKQVSGVYGIGIQALVFGFHFHLHGWKEPYLWMKNLKAKVSIPGKGNLGTASSEHSFMLRNYEYPSDSYPLLSIDLSREQIEELERIRGGGGLSFSLTLSLEVFGSTEPSFITEQITVDINQSHWLSILKDMHYSDVLLYEVKQPLNLEAASSEYIDLHQSLRDAQKHYEAGQYNDAVADCRIALEQIEKIFNYRADTKCAIGQYCSDNRKDREAMNKDQRALMIKEAIWNYTHLPHHSDANGKTVSLSRAEAGMILGCLFAFIGKATYA